MLARASVPLCSTAGGRQPGLFRTSGWRPAADDRLRPFGYTAVELPAPASLQCASALGRRAFGLSFDAAGQSARAFTRIGVLRINLTKLLAAALCGLPPAGRRGLKTRIRERGVGGDPSCPCCRWLVRGLRVPVLFWPALCSKERAGSPGHGFPRTGTALTSCGERGRPWCRRLSC